MSLAEISVNNSVDHLFRRHAGQMVAVLCRIFGLARLDLIEDAVQEAMIRALKNWSVQGLPKNPRAWLIEVAKNRIYDQLRRSRKFDAVGEDLETAAGHLPADRLSESVGFAGEIGDDVLRMMFACCHPSISPDSQVALTLKTVGGFSVREIAAAFLSRDEAVAKLLTRAKQKLRRPGVRLEIPPPGELELCLEPVLKVLYLLFNEGYNSMHGEKLVRRDLCLEAIRLGEILAGSSVTKRPKVHALLALFYFQAARLKARFDEDGDIVLLSDQDRSVWDKGMIGRGLRHFRRSAIGSEISSYHLEAEIASVHALSRDFESTNWTRILECYEMLAGISPSPVVRLNKAVAAARARDFRTGLTEMNRLRGEPGFEEYLPFLFTFAGLLMENGEGEAGSRYFSQALELTRSESVKRLIKKKMSEFESGKAALRKA